MQLEIYKPTSGHPLPPVKWNFSEIKQWLSDGLDQYKGRVYDENQITQAKKDAAALRKLKEAIDGRRKEVKAFYKLIHGYPPSTANPRLRRSNRLPFYNVQTGESTPHPPMVPFPIPSVRSSAQMLILFSRQRCLMLSSSKFITSVAKYCILLCCVLELNLKE